MRVKVCLDTKEAVYEFVNIATQIPHQIYLSADNLRVSAKSLLGALYTMEWADVWCECDKDIYTKIEKFVV